MRFCRKICLGVLVVFLSLWREGVVEAVLGDVHAEDGGGEDGQDVVVHNLRGGTQNFKLSIRIWGIWSQPK